jgi:hypothetical protein
MIPCVLRAHGAFIFGVQQFKKESNLTLVFITTVITKLQTVKAIYFLYQSVNVLHQIHAKPHLKIVLSF